MLVQFPCGPRPDGFLRGRAAGQDRRPGRRRRRAARRSPRRRRRSGRGDSALRLHRPQDARAASTTICRCTSGPTATTSPSTRRPPSSRSTWWIARRSSTARVSTANPAWIIPDNHIRFAVFARAALGVARVLFRTEIFHCHDWQAGLVPAYLRTTFATDPTFLGVPGPCSPSTISATRACFRKPPWPRSRSTPALFRPDGMEFFGHVSYIKGGIAFADALNTVSPTYAREIQTPEYGFGLDGALRARAGRADRHPERRGLPRVEPGDRSAASRPTIPPDDLAGKRVCKRALLEEFGLPPEAMDRGRCSASFRASRGRRASTSWPRSRPPSSPTTSIWWRWARATRSTRSSSAACRRNIPGAVAVRFGFDNGLAHRIEAGADMFLMPSRYEPCGLEPDLQPAVRHGAGGSRHRRPG